MFHKITNLSNGLTSKTSGIKSAVKKKKTEKNDIRNMAERKVNLQISLKIHLVAFIFGTILLLIINLLFTPQYLWVMEATMGWGIGYFLHLIGYLLYSKPHPHSGRTDILFHFIIYLVVNAYLVVKNITTTSFPWVIYPIIFWGFGLLVHGIIYNLYYKDVKSILTGEPISKKQLAIEKEIQKMKVKGDLTNVAK